MFFLTWGNLLRSNSSGTCRLSGLEIKDKSNPNGDIEIVCTGLRPGEKLLKSYY